MTAPVDRTVAHLNIEYYKRLLATETNEDKRKILKKLLAEEEAKLAAAHTKGAGAARSNGRRQD